MAFPGTVAFADPAIDSQRVFRAVLEAMASPGERFPIPPMLEARGSLSGVALAVLLALADHETPVWLAPPLRDPAVLRFLQFGSGCPVTEDPAKAAFAVARLAVEGLPSLDSFCPGSAFYPDESATLLLLHEATVLHEANEAESSPTHPVRLQGPGVPPAEIASDRRFWVPGASAAFWRQVAENHARYPLGIDLLFLDESGVAALPRSTRVEPV